MSASVSCCMLPPQAIRWNHTSRFAARSNSTPSLSSMNDNRAVYIQLPLSTTTLPTSLTMISDHISSSASTRTPPADIATWLSDDLTSAAPNEGIALRVLFSSSMSNAKTPAKYSQRILATWLLPIPPFACKVICMRSFGWWRVSTWGSRASSCSRVVGTSCWGESMMVSFLVAS